MSNRKLQVDKLVKKYGVEWREEDDCFGMYWREYGWKVRKGDTPQDDLKRMLLCQLISSELGLGNITDEEYKQEMKGLGFS